MYPTFMGPFLILYFMGPFEYSIFYQHVHIYLPEVMSPLKLTAENTLSQLCSYFLDVNMSTTDKDSQDCTMDLSQVEITDVSLKLVVYYV